MKYKKIVIVMLMMSVLSLIAMQLKISDDIFGSIENLTYKYRESKAVSLIAGMQTENDDVNNKNDIAGKAEVITEEVKIKSNDITDNKEDTDVQRNINQIKEYNSDDKTEIGIVITNSSNNIYHDTVSMESEGTINVYYGKNLNSTKSVGNEIAIDSLKYFKKNKYVKITSDKKINIKNLPNNSYEGDFFVYSKDEGFVIVNKVSVEKYLFSVVASEMPLSFEKEALKSQAVCARTYTYAHLDNDKYKEFDAIMDDTTSYQAYGKKTDKKIVEAVKSTRGEVLTRNNELINAYYFSTSCGYTTDDRIWGNAKNDYLRSKYVSAKESVIDVSTKDNFNSFIKNNYDAYESKCAFYRWKVTINAETIKSKLYEYKGENVGNIQNIEIAERGAGGIVSKIRIIGEKGSAVITNQNEIRNVFSINGNELKLNDGSVRMDFGSLPSAFFTVDKISNKKYMLTGGGFGHGSGMSQYGANEMAKKGKGYEEILNFFYTDVTCGRIEIH